MQIHFLNSGLCRYYLLFEYNRLTKMEMKRCFLHAIKSIDIGIEISTYLKIPTKNEKAGYLKQRQKCKIKKVEGK